MAEAGSRTFVFEFWVAGRVRRSRPAPGDGTSRLFEAELIVPDPNGHSPELVTGTYMLFTERSGKVAFSNYFLSFLP